jgi:hypothetical protein
MAKPKGSKKQTKKGMGQTTGSRRKRQVTSDEDQSSNDEDRTPVQSQKRVRRNSVDEIEEKEDSDIEVIEEPGEDSDDVRYNQPL